MSKSPLRVCTNELCSSSTPKKVSQRASEQRFGKNICRISVYCSTTIIPSAIFMSSFCVFFLCLSQVKTWLTITFLMQHHGVLFSFFLHKQTQNVCRGKCAYDFADMLLNGAVLLINELIFNEHDLEKHNPFVTFMKSAKLILLRLSCQSHQSTGGIYHLFVYLYTTCGHYPQRGEKGFQI